MPHDFSLFYLLKITIRLNAPSVSSGETALRVCHATLAPARFAKQIEVQVKPGGGQALIDKSNEMRMLEVIRLFLMMSLIQPSNSPPRYRSHCSRWDPA